MKKFFCGAVLGVILTSVASVSARIVPYGRRIASRPANIRAAYAAGAADMLNAIVEARADVAALEGAGRCLDRKAPTPADLTGYADRHWTTGIGSNPAQGLLKALTDCSGSGSPLR